MQGERCAEQRAHGRGERGQAVARGGGHVRPPVHLQLDDGQVQERLVQTDGSGAAGLDRRGLPAWLAQAERSLARRLAGHLHQHGGRILGAGDVRDAQRQQQKDRHDQRELDQRLGEAWRPRPATAGRAGGQILVFFALLVSALLATLGLLLTVELVVAQRRTLQTVADAAALASVWRLLAEVQSGERSDERVLSAALTYAFANGLPSDGTPQNRTHLEAVYVDAQGAEVVPTRRVGDGGRFPEAAQGVRVVARASVAPALGAVLGASSLLVEAEATAGLVTAEPPSEQVLVIPVAVHVSDFERAFASEAEYDLLDPRRPPPGGVPTLDYTSPSNSPPTGAQDYGSKSLNIQYWSDGQHENGRLRVGGRVALADALYAEALATGLLDNVRRQQLGEGGAAYALVNVPLWDSSVVVRGRRLVQVAGFALLRVRRSEISATSIRGVFVPYPIAAWGLAATPELDPGARVVRLRR